MSTPPLPSLPDQHATARVIRDTAKRLALDLRGLTVLTEAATGSYAVTAAIAALGGASLVFAVSRDSAYGSAADAEHQTLHMARACGAEEPVHVIGGLDEAIVRNSDVITNLGFVRPIDARAVAWMKSTAVVALMCESWELRPRDVDVEACRAHEILVLATNEHDVSFPLFSYSGPLAVRMLSDAGFEVPGTHVAVLGRDHFAPEVAGGLEQAGAFVTHDPSVSPASAARALAGVQAIVVADYSEAKLVGDGGVVSAEDVARLAPGATVIQFAGAIDARSLNRCGVRTWPSPVVEPRRMSRTFAHLGPRPVVELHAAGLKVAECGARARLAGLTPDEAAHAASHQSPLVQQLLH